MRWTRSPGQLTTNNPASNPNLNFYLLHWVDLLLKLSLENKTDKFFRQKRGVNRKLQLETKIWSQSYSLKPYNGLHRLKMKSNVFMWSKDRITHRLQSPSFFLSCVISQPHSQFPADIVWCHSLGFLLILSSLPGPLHPTQLPVKILPSRWALSPPASASVGAHSECFKSTQWITISISQPLGHKPVLSLAWGSLRGMTWVSSIFVCLAPSRAPDKSTFSENVCWMHA